MTLLKRFESNMDLLKIIEKIFENNTCYALPKHAVDQAESLKSLSKDLYTDSKRFIYELLQNADDSSFPDTNVDIYIRFFGDIMLLAHTGQPFTARDIEGLCAVNHGTKKNSIEKTGYKGIGFKAVFGQSNKVIVYSEHNYFRFDETYNFAWRTEWEQSKDGWETDNDRKFLYPWQIIPILTDKEDIPQEIDSFLSSGDWKVATLVRLSNKKDVENAVTALIENVNMFLFLKSIKSIEFETDRIYKISIVRNDDKIEIHQNATLKAEWLLYSQQLNIPPEIKDQILQDSNVPDKLKKARAIELSFAAKIENGQLFPLKDGEQLLYAYLPTGEKKYYLPILVNSSFLTSANRESLHENSVWNQWLFESIAIGLFKWIAELVKGEHQCQAYKLIPNRFIYSDALSISFNNGIDKALESIPFIISEQKILLTRDQVILDFTFLWKNKFVGNNNIRQFVIQRDNKPSIAPNPFVTHTDFGNVLKGLGVSSFDWEDMSQLFLFPQFIQNHSIADNIELIRHLKYLIDRENIRKVYNKITSWKFIYDHKTEFKSPSDIYFPAPDDYNWNNPDSELSFLHPDIQHWLLTSHEYRIWLETLGVTEKTDLTYLQKTILANPSAYTTFENAIPTILNIYMLYSKGELNNETLNKLGQLKILTQNGSLVTANQCYLSDVYRPRLPLEVLIAEDIFVSESYLPNHCDKDEWKRFFKKIGVKEGVEIFKIEEKCRIDLIISNYSLKEEYFNKYFYAGNFKADYYKNIIFLSFLHKTYDYRFSIRFWEDIIENLIFSEITEPSIAYWGYPGMSGQNSGNRVENYMIWYINNQDCVPTKMHNCRKATDVFLNDTSIIDLVSNYLPVFDGPDLSADWKSFFQFKTQITLSDYLELLSNIVADATEDGRIKKENRERIQDVYTFLLNLTTNWSDAEIAQVQEWAKDIMLPDKSGFLRTVDDLRYYADGDISIFQDEFNFVFLNSPNRKHSHIETFLNILGIEIFKQEKFSLSYNEEIESASLLKDKLNMISPYLEKWILSEEQVNAESKIEKLYKGIEKLDIHEVSELKIKYNKWKKIVQFHLKDDVLYVTSPWDSNMSLMYLPDKLCYYLDIKGFENELDFLLRSKDDEIQKHFKHEHIKLPEQVIIAEEKEEQAIEGVNREEDKTEITSDEILISLGIETVDQLNKLLKNDQTLSSFFHTSTASYEKREYAQRLINRAKTNIIAYLPTIGYDCCEATEIAPSIFRGVKKDKKDICIVTRPSDNDQVLLYYTSEFDVLEYVDAEFWYEDGKNSPKRMNLGQLLKKTGINKIPVRNTVISNSDIEALFKTPKSETLDFDPIPYDPQKIARIISSFANTEGGKLVFGLREIDPFSNEVIGLSSDFDVIDITKKAISLLSPMPPVTYEYKRNEDKDVFVIKIEKSETSILLGDKKYIRKGVDSVLEVNRSKEVILNNPKFKRTFAIIISIENYAERSDNQVSKVKYANKDASNFKQVLIDVMNVSEDDIFIFQDEKALKSSLEYELKSLFHYLTEEDRLIFYYVGHGFHDGIKNYLSTYDMHIFNIAGTAIPLQNILLDPLKRSKCNNALIFIDACAKSFINENERAQISDINDEELLVLTEEFPNYITFLSCQPGQSSYSSDILKNGIWTHHLVDALSGNAKGVMKGDRYITDRSLSNYLSRNVAIYTKDELKYDQNPRVILDSSYENVIVEIDV